MALKIEDITPYRLTIIAAIVVLCVSVATVTILGGAQAAAPYLSLIGSIAIPGLLGLWRSEGNAREVEQVKQTQVEQHAQNQEKIQELADALKEKS